MRLRRLLTDGCPSYKSVCCAGLMLRKDAQLGSSQAAANNSCRLYPMPKAISAIACVFSKLEAWCKSVARRGAKRTMSGSPRKGVRRPLKFQEVMIKEQYHIEQYVARSVLGVYSLHWRRFRW